MTPHCSPFPHLSLTLPGPGRENPPVRAGEIRRSAPGECASVRATRNQCGTTPERFRPGTAPSATLPPQAGRRCKDWGGGHSGPGGGGGSDRSETISLTRVTWVMWRQKIYRGLVLSASTLNVSGVCLRSKDSKDVKIGSKVWDVLFANVTFIHRRWRRCGLRPINKVIPKFFKLQIKRKLIHLTSVYSLTHSPICPHNALFSHLKLFSGFRVCFIINNGDFALITYFLENNDLLAVRPQTNQASLGFLLFSPSLNFLEGLGGGEVNPFITKKKI